MRTTAIIPDHREEAHSEMKKSRQRPTLGSLAMGRVRVTKDKMEHVREAEIPKRGSGYILEMERKE